VVVLQDLAEKLSLRPEKTTVAIQGMGNVGYWFADSAHKAGFKVVGVSDSRGAIWSEDGIDPGEAIRHKKETGSVVGLKGGKNLSEDEFFAHEVDVLVPAALENSINMNNVESIKAKVIIEMANGPVTADAFHKLVERGVLVVPDILANAGGVATSYLEWKQNMNKESWEEDVVLAKLKQLMREAFSEVWKVSENEKVDLKLAAYMVAVKRIVEAKEAKVG